MTKKTALIIGSNGQDGKLLRKLLEGKGYSIVGVSREGIQQCGSMSYSENVVNILDNTAIHNLIKSVQPDEIYYLAAYHHSSQDNVPVDDILLQKSREIHVDGYWNILQAIQKNSPKTKICYASSCLIYAGTETNQQNESTLPIPNSPYGITKLYAMHLGNRFAEKYNLHIVNTILYNHESEYRSPKFVSMKIIQGAINISKGLQDNIVLGDLSTQVDRGYAGDYVIAMRGVLQTDKRGDYIVSSGKLHTIQDMVEIVFGYLKLDWKKYIIFDTNIIRRKRGMLFGDNCKIMRETGWKPEKGFNEMLLYISDCIK